MNTIKVRPILITNTNMLFPTFQDKKLILINLVPYEGIEYRTKYYNSVSKKIEICQSLSELNDFCFKVIATQEQISPEYIQQFINEYNKGEVNDIEIEVEQWTEFSGDNHNTPTISKPKLTNGFVNIIYSTIIDNKKTVTINLEQKTYTEKEVILLCQKAFEDNCKYSSFKDFIEENFNNNKKK